MELKTEQEGNPWVAARLLLDHRVGSEVFVSREFQAETEVDGRSDVDVFFFFLHREAKANRIAIWRRCFEMLDAVGVP